MDNLGVLATLGTQDTRQINNRGRSQRMDNLEVLATLGTQDMRQINDRGKGNREWTI